MTQPIVRLVAQREEKDCAVAAIGTATGQTYEDVLRVVSRVDRLAGGRQGLTLDQIRRVLRQLGFDSRWGDLQDIDEDAGLLWVVCPGDRREDHIVYLDHGLIWDTNSHTAWKPDVYMATHARRPGGLLTLSEAS